MSIEIDAQIAETNRLLTELNARLDGLGAAMGATLALAAKGGRRARRVRRPPEEVKEILRTQFGQPESGTA